MSQRRTVFALCAVAMSAVLLLPDVASAQLFGRGGRAFGGLGNYGGWGNYGGMGYGWGNYGGWGNPTYGWSSNWGTPYYGNMGGNWIMPGYSYSNPQPYNYSSPIYYGNFTPNNLAVSSQSLYPPSGSMQGASSNRAFIDVRVPPNAKVLFDNNPTQQQGPERRFMTPPLEANSHYSYKITAEWTQDGQNHRENRTVQLTPGQVSQVDFMTPQNTNGSQPQQQQQQPQQQQQRPQRQQPPTQQAPQTNLPPDR